MPPPPHTEYQRYPVCGGGVLGSVSTCTCLALSSKLAFSIHHGIVILNDFASVSIKLWNSTMLIVPINFTIFIGKRKEHCLLFSLRNNRQHLRIDCRNSTAKAGILIASAVIGKPNPSIRAKEDCQMADLQESLRKLAMAGIGAAGEAVEKAGEVIEDLSQKGESLLAHNAAANEQLKHDIKKSIKENVSAFAGKPDLESVLSAMETFTPEELAAIVKKLEELAKGDSNANG
ncbi:MAG: hypothetical protein RSC91_07425, partial [Clostridia bacterium]